MSFISTYIGNVPATSSAGGSTRTVTDFTATSGQTVFTVTYAVGYVDVYRNGIKLGTTDFAATDGSTVVLVTPAIAGDLIQCVSFSSLAVYTNITTDTFSGTGSNAIFTLSKAPADSSSLLVVISGVTQAPNTYTVSGTTLTFSVAPPAGTDNISARFLGTLATTSVATIGGGATGLTPAAATSGAVTLGGVLVAANGGTGLSSPGTSGNFLQSTGTGWTSAANPPPFASGTALVFAQTSAPTGWTKSTTHNDKALRVVSGTASSGGSVTGITFLRASNRAASIAASSAALACSHLAEAVTAQLGSSVITSFGNLIPKSSSINSTQPLFVTSLNCSA